MLSQADPEELTERQKFDDSFEEVMSQVDERDYYKEVSPKSSVKNWLNQNQKMDKKPKIFKFKKRQSEEKVSSSVAKKFRSENDVPSTSQASMFEQAQKRQDSFFSFLEKQQEIMAKEQEIFQQQLNSFRN